MVDQSVMQPKLIHVNLQSNQDEIHRSACNHLIHGQQAPALPWILASYPIRIQPLQPGVFQLTTVVTHARMRDCSRPGVARMSRPRRKKNDIRANVAVDRREPAPRHSQAAWQCSSTTRLPLKNSGDWIHRNYKKAASSL